VDVAAVVVVAMATIAAVAVAATIVAVAVAATIRVARN
jgi:hypothetical protein